MSRLSHAGPLELEIEDRNETVLTVYALNFAGQRTCRQCGETGRYKDGKCVEKWGPGPKGPGTVCDR